MGILRVSIDDGGEVFDGLLVVIDHLVGLSSLVHESNIALVALHASTVGEDRFFKLLHTAVRKTDVIVNIGFNRVERFIFECIL